MDILRSIILGIVQGATEFVPVSSSGHLVLVPWLLRWPEPGLLFDTVAHWGTLVALIAVFWRDLLDIVRDWWRATWSRLADREPVGPDVRANARLGWWIVVGTIPGALLGYLFEDWFEALFSSPSAVAAFLLVTAAGLTVSERWSHSRKSLEQMNVLDALLIGLAQAAAIAPGISRSGATISMGLGRGLSRENAARYAFLLSIPIILGAGLFQLVDLFGMTGVGQQLPSLAAGFLAAALSGYLCIRFLLRYLQRGRLYPFAAYCAALGVAALILAQVR